MKPLMGVTVGSTGLAIVVAIVVAIAVMVLVAVFVLHHRWRRSHHFRRQLEKRLADRDQQLAIALVDSEGVRSQLARRERLATLGFLLAGIAHELNTPVGAVSSMYDTVRRAQGKVAALAEKESLDAEDLATLRKVARATRRADQVIENGLDRIRTLVLSLRSAARGDSPVPESFDVNAGIESALLLLHNELKRDIEVEKELGDLPEIRAVPAQINQVFLNLLLNARQAIPEKGRIRVITRRDADGVRIDIVDNGVGIAPENLERIFEPDFTTKPLNEGTGLGLAITRSVCASHGGTVEVASLVGEGSTFSVWLPQEPPCRRPSTVDDGVRG